MWQPRNVNAHNTQIVASDNLQATRFAMSPKLHFTAKRVAYKLQLNADWGVGENRAT